MNKDKLLSTLEQLHDAIIEFDHELQLALEKVAKVTDELWAAKRKLSSEHSTYSAVARLHLPSSTCYFYKCTRRTKRLGVLSVVSSDQKRHRLFRWNGLATRDYYRKSKHENN